VDVEVAGCPWDAGHRLARVALRGRGIDREASAGSNLVFLIDVSGSMDEPSKLPLVQSALSMMVRELDGRDRVAVVVYAGDSAVALPPTPGDRKAEILSAIGRLEAGGGTNGGAGLEQAYRLAREGRIEGGVNRVILATDGDFNLGMTDRGALMRLVEQQARAGVSLSALGFGMGNYKDDMLELLADHGDGNYAYVDGPAEARKVLVEQLAGTLAVIAKDVKVQVEFNPTRVGAWRLIGYENRALRAEDFNDDRKDAGEIGAGHTVTALYEIVPPGAAGDRPPVDPLRYQRPGALTAAAAGSDELLTLKLRYKLPGGAEPGGGDPDGGASRLLSFPVVDSGRGAAEASADFSFAAAVAAFGMILRESPHRGAADFEMVRELAQRGMRGGGDGAGGSDDALGYRAGFVRLVGRAAALRPQVASD
jgi:Ca-activated chloride channel family protein